MARHTFHSTFFANKSLSLVGQHRGAAAEENATTQSELDSHVARLSLSLGSPSAATVSGTADARHNNVVAAGGDRDIEMTA